VRCFWLEHRVTDCGVHCDLTIRFIHEENVASIAVTNKLGGALVGTYEGPLLLFEYARSIALPETEV
jgi:hypothetical protein